MNLLLTNLHNVRFAKEPNGSTNRNAFVAELLNSDRNNTVRFDRRANGWDVELVIAIDGRVVHNEHANAAAKHLWNELRELADVVEHNAEAAAHNAHRAACKILFGA